MELPPRNSSYLISRYIWLFYCYGLSDVCSDSDESSDDFTYEANAPKGRKSEKLKRRVTQKVNDQNYIVVFC